MSQHRRNRSKPQLAVESLETRAMMSAAPTSLARHRGPYQPHPPVIQLAANHFPPAGAPAPVESNIGTQGEFALNTVDQGWRMTHSAPVRNVGINYAKLAVSGESRAVGGAYARAALRGDGADLKRLGHAPLVKKVGDNFTRLSQSKYVKRVGDSFANFGKSVANQFTTLFG